jgi:hypothetical protein
MQSMRRRAAEDFSGEAAAVKAHIAKRCEGQMGPRRNQKKGTSKSRRAFQQNVWQLLVGLSL